MPMPAPFTIRIMTWAEALPLARPVREKVFVEEQKVSREDEWDDWDEPSDHAVALDAGGNPVGTARLLPDGRIGRMAVLKEWRGKRVGAALLHAQTHAAGFYRKFGFSERGGEFLEAGIPHVEMILDLFPPGSAGS